MKKFMLVFAGCCMAAFVGGSESFSAQTHATIGKETQDHPAMIEGKIQNHQGGGVVRAIWSRVCHFAGAHSEDICCFVFTVCFFVLLYPIVKCERLKKEFESQKGWITWLEKDSAAKNCSITNMNRH
jgi:hypothetical protein